MNTDNETKPAFPGAATAEKKGGKAAAAAGAFAWLIAVGLGCVAGWLVRDMAPEKKQTAEAPKVDIATVAVTNAQMRPYNKPTPSVAHVEAMQEVDLLPQVDGYIKTIDFAEGAIVKAEDPLFTLDDERYLAVVHQREADLEAAEAEQRRADRYLERTKNTKAGVISDAARDDAEAKAEAAKAAVMQAKANLVVAKYDLKKAKVTAPISGQIGKANAHKGDYVSPAKGALARIVQTDPIRVTFPMTDRDYVSFRKSAAEGRSAGEDVRIRLLLPDGSEYPAEGKWDFGDNSMSVETATISMRASFPNPDRLLVPGSYVTVLTDMKTAPEYLCVPQTAISDSMTGGTSVYVLKPDMTVELRPVKTLGMFEGWVPVTEGLSEGERVVTSGTGKIAPGMKVKLAAPTPNEENTPGYKPGLKD